MLEQDSVEGTEQPWSWFAEGQEGAGWLSEPPNKEFGLMVVLRTGSQTGPPIATAEI